MIEKQICEHPEGFHEIGALLNALVTLYPDLRPARVEPGVRDRGTPPVFLRVVNLTIRNRFGMVIWCPDTKAFHWLLWADVGAAICGLDDVEDGAHRIASAMRTAVEER